MNEGRDGCHRFSGFSPQHHAYLPNRANEVLCRKICKIRICLSVGRKLLLSGNFFLPISKIFDQIHVQQW